jgi:uncharacterized OB-fold protein
MSRLPTPPAPVTSETAPFWDAAADGRLVLPRCDACQRLIWYPREFCPHCGSTAVTWAQLSGRGRIYSVSVVRRAPHPDFADAVPYSLALVDLDEGARVMTNVVTDDPVQLDSLVPGQPVEAVFDAVADAGDGAQAILRFRPIDQE